MSIEINGRTVSCRVTEAGTLVIDVQCNNCQGSGIQKWIGTKGTPCIVANCKEGKIELEVHPFFERILLTDIETVHGRSWIAHKRHPDIVKEGVPYSTWKPGDVLPDDIPEHLKSKK
jgi:hypothetical protein